MPDFKVRPTVNGTNLVLASEVAGGGDMNKSTYDTNNDGIVDNADKLDGYQPSITSTPNTAVVRDASKYVYADYFNSAAIGDPGGNPTGICGVNGNGFIYAFPQSRLSVGNADTLDGYHVTTLNSDGVAFWWGEAGPSGVYSYSVNNALAEQSPYNWTLNLPSGTWHVFFMVNGIAGADYGAPILRLIANGVELDKLDPGDSMSGKAPFYLHGRYNLAAGSYTISLRFATTYVPQTGFSAKIDHIKYVVLCFRYA